jgi:hypothetical protein
MRATRVGKFLARWVTPAKFSQWRDSPTAAHEPAGAGAGRLPSLENRDSGDQRRLITCGALHEAFAARGKVIDDFGGRADAGRRSRSG